jgi:hypothetical protein
MFITSQHWWLPALTAETIVVALEGTKTIKHSRRLSSRITHSKPVAECELVLWLASLLWRTRCATTKSIG